MLDFLEPNNYNITKIKMSTASVSGEFHLNFSVGVQSPAETLNEGLPALIEFII